jgi:predicted nucleotidyltransferase
METLIKQTREVGTSAGVLLPRKWLNKQVVVTLHSPNKADIASDVIGILFDKDLNEEARGIYLYGSYARGDYDFNSDIDVLVITRKVNKLIKYKNFEILLVSEDNFSKNIAHSLHYLSLLKEAKTLLNENLIEKFKIKKIKLDFKDELNEIERIIKINEETAFLCKDNKKNIPDGIVYSVVLRLRELYMIKCLIPNKLFSKADFLKFTGDKNYSTYNRIKMNKREENNTKYEEISNLLSLSRKWLNELKD